MIPKKIHYCWISGDPYPDLVQHCLNSWHTHLSDYEFILWDAQRVKQITCSRLSDALTAKKYSAVADYVRLHALYYEGGIYLDADVEVLQNFDDLLFLKSFIGLEQSGNLEAAIIGAEPNLDWMNYALQQFQETPLFEKDGSLSLFPLPVALNRLLSEYFQCSKNQFTNLKSDQLQIFPKNYFSPKSFHTKKIKISLNTYTIHHFDSHWVNKNFYFRIKMLIHRFLIFVFGTSVHQRISTWIQKKNRYESNYKIRTC